jgi:hypothetical protein
MSLSFGERLLFFSIRDKGIFHHPGSAMNGPAKLEAIIFCPGGRLGKELLVGKQVFFNQSLEIITSLANEYFTARLSRLLQGDLKGRTVHV